MTTEDIRREVTNHAPTRESIWPNGLGYCWRGWEYSFGSRGWFASYGRTGKLGNGSTPTEARENAQPVAETV